MSIERMIDGQWFIGMFAGRTDAWGGDEGLAVREEVTVDTYMNHLRGLRPIGIYPLVEVEGKGWCVRWGCVDIDVEDKPLALNLVRTLRLAGVHSWLEKSRSKGYHVWVFSLGWCPAEIMRRALLWACDIAGVPPKEINPKQLTLPEGGLGNYVRLPYPGALSANKLADRQVMVEPTLEHTPIPMPLFLDLARAHRTAVSTLRALAGRYVEPRPAYVPAPPSRFHDPKMSPLTRHIFNEGPSDGSDRSDTLFRLAAKLHADGFSASECLHYLADADQRWGKFHGRADAERRLREIVERAR